jgi:hypothetical protein
MAAPEMIDRGSVDVFRSLTVDLVVVFKPSQNFIRQFQDLYSPIPIPRSYQTVRHGVRGRVEALTEVLTTIAGACRERPDAPHRYSAPAAALLVLSSASHS